MNITLSVPPAVVLSVRSWAERNGTTLNQYIRDCLEAKSREEISRQEKLAEDFCAFAYSLPRTKAPRGWKFNRNVDCVREMKCAK